VEAGEVYKKRVDATPHLSDWKREFGDKVKVDERTGDFTISLKEKAEIRRAHEMQEDARRIEVERGSELHARREKEYTERRKERRSNMNLTFGLSGATGKYVQGPDKLCFVWNDGWEPVTLFSQGADGEQRDPDGGVWVKDDSGDWVPKDLVA
jgi:hypothetical protein